MDSIMNNVSVNGVRIAYLETGTGPETVVFSHSYLLDHRHFQPQIERLKDRFLCLAFDHRGHGESQEVVDPYGMEDLYSDTVAFLEAVAGGPCHFIGLSTGGYVGVRLAYRRPDLLRSLILMDTSADAEAAWPLFQYRFLLFLARFMGPRFVAKMAYPYLFGRSFRTDPDRAVESAEILDRMAMGNAPSMIAFGRAIFGRESVYREMGGVTVPTMVVVGEEDVSTPVPSARRLAEAIPDARLEIIPKAGHICTLEQPDLVNTALEEFLAAHGGAG